MMRFSQNEERTSGYRHQLPASHTHTRALKPRIALTLHAGYVIAEEKDSKNAGCFALSGARAKFWIRPVALAENIGFPSHELNHLISVIDENQDLIERIWHEHFST